MVLLFVKGTINMDTKETGKEQILDIAICDDNSNELQKEYDLISEVLDEKGLACTIDTFGDPKKLLSEEKAYDIVFLDIEMGEISGMKTAEQIRIINKNSMIFFVTNHGGYIEEAFNEHPFRFWTKPIDKHKLIYGIDSALKELKAAGMYITITTGSQKQQIPAKNILCIFTENKQLNIMTLKGHFTVSDTYKNIYEQLKVCNSFCEICRGICVNLYYVIDYTNKQVICGCGAQKYSFDISRRKYNNFHKSFIEWAGGK